MRGISHSTGSSGLRPSSSLTHSRSPSSNETAYFGQYDTFIPPATESGGPFATTLVHDDAVVPEVTGPETMESQLPTLPAFLPQPMEVELDGDNMLDVLDDAMTQLSQPVPLEEEIIVRATNLQDAAYVLYHELRHLLYRTERPTNIPSSAIVSNLSFQTLNHRRIRVEM